MSEEITPTSRVAFRPVAGGGNHLKATTVVPEEQQFMLLRSSPGRVQKLLAIAIVLAILIASLLTIGPLSTMQPAPVYAFVASYATAMFVTDLTSAFLLFAQFTVLRSRALLVIASGYLFTALVVIPWMLTFPGVFAPTGLLGAGLQSTNSLFIFWHAGFPSFVIAYAFLKEADPAIAMRSRKGSAITAVLASIAMTTSLVCMATFLIIANDLLLPPLMRDNVHFARLWHTSFPVIGGGFAMLCVFAFIALWVRWRTVLDLWLMVVMCVYLGEICLSNFPIPVRFSVGWYAGRACSLLSGCLVLFVLLYEIAIQYSQLIRAVLAQRREHAARLVTQDAVVAMISHEIKQPLSAMITRSETGLRWLDRSMPDIDKARTQLRQVIADGHRMGAVIENIRGNFRKDVQVRASIDVNDLIAETLDLVREDLQRNQIMIKAVLNAGLPQIVGQKSQLQQVLLNLINNAADAMKSNEGPRILFVDAAVHDSGGVVVSLADTGIGISSHDIERIFNPMFTTKADGMGMGLSICRTIIETYGGRLWVSQNKPEGAVFHFTLLVDVAIPADTSFEKAR